MAYALLRDVTPQKQQWTIKGRITRFSEFLSSDQPPKVLRLDFVVLDEEGTAMDGQIPTACLTKFKPLLQEGSLYIIKNFHVAGPRTKYRPVNHPYLMKFTAYTKISLASLEDPPSLECKVPQEAQKRSEIFGSPMKESLSLTGSSFCRWYCNPELPEVTALRNSCVGPLSPPTWFGAAPSQTGPQRITVTELAAFDDPHPIYTNRYIINIRIKTIVPNQSWWYYACKLCNKGIKQDTGDIKCTKPGCSNRSAHNRYLLPLLATDPVQSPQQDEQPTIELVLFGNTAQELIGAPIDSLIASGEGVGTFLPKRITALYGKEYEVRVSVSPISMRQTKITYQVDRIMTVINTAPSQAPPAEHGPGQEQTQASSSTLPSPSTNIDIGSAVVTNAVPPPAELCALPATPSIPATTPTHVAPPSSPSAITPAVNKCDNMPAQVSTLDPSHTPPPKTSLPMDKTLPATSIGSKRSADSMDDTKGRTTESHLHPKKARNVRRRLLLHDSKDSS